MIWHWHGRRGSHGIGFGLGAYGLWGILPIYWRLLDHVPAMQVLAHRFIWSLPVVLAILAVAGRLRRLGGLSVRAYGLLALAGAIIAINWGTYIWAVSNGHVIETSLGYFVSPLMTVLVAVIVLRERLRRAQWIAVGIAGVAGVVLTVSYGRLPWIGLVLASTVSVYALIKKKVRVGALESVAVETAALFVPMLVFLLVLQVRGDGAFTTVDAGTDALLIGTGLTTAVPLLLFAAAAGRTLLSTLGLISYLAPTLQFVLGLTVFDEDVPGIRFLGFGLVWTALVIFTADALRQRHHRPQRTPPGSTTA